MRRTVMTDVSGLVYSTYWWWVALGGGWGEGGREGGVSAVQCSAVQGAAPSEAR